jgi:AcrR family transcriptional regulator
MSPSHAARPTTTPTKARIIDAAAEVMATRGLAHTTTREIARAAGYSEATLYKHFTDKEELFVAVMRDRLPTGFIDTLGELQQRVGTGTVAAHLEEVVRQAVPFYVEIVPMMAATFAEPTLLERHKEILRASGLGPHLAVTGLAAYLRAEQRRGRIAASARPDSVAALLLGACFQRAFFVRFVGEHVAKESLAKFAKTTVGQLLPALTAPGA